MALVAGIGSPSRRSTARPGSRPPAKNSRALVAVPARRGAGETRAGLIGKPVRFDELTGDDEAVVREYNPATGAQKHRSIWAALSSYYFSS